MKRDVSFRLTLLALAVAAMLSPARAAPGEVIAAPRPAIYDASATFSLRANDVEVPVVAYNALYDYATFTLANGPCELRVMRIDGQPIGEGDIGVSPLKYALPIRREGNTLTITIDRPLYLIVTLGTGRKLVLAVDAPEVDVPPAHGTGVFNIVRAFDADPTGERDATDAFARAVDAATAVPGGNGVVYVPNGVYHLTHVELKSNVTLYLESAAVLRLRGRTRDDFTVRYRKNSQNRDGTWFIYTAAGATNVRILGRGTIDGDGHRIARELNLSSHLVVPMNCRGFLMDGPIVRESGLWGTVVANSRDVTIRNTKHFNRHDMGEDDCIDVCNSQDVRVQRTIAISLDDPYSTKTWTPDTDLTRSWAGTFDGNARIVFDDCLAWTRCFGFKIGAGVFREQRDIAVTRGVVYDSAHAIGVSHSYGAADVRGVTFDGIDVERNTMTNLGRSWARFVIDRRKPNGGEAGGVFDVTLRNITVRDAGTDDVAVEGLSDAHAIRGLRFEAITMPNQSTPATDLPSIGVRRSSFATDVSCRPTSP